jgi:hypothetical protein
MCAMCACLYLVHLPIDEVPKMRLLMGFEIWIPSSRVGKASTANVLQNGNGMCGLQGLTAHGRQPENRRCPNQVVLRMYLSQGFTLGCGTCGDPGGSCIGDAIRCRGAAGPAGAHPATGTPARSRITYTDENTTYKPTWLGLKLPVFPSSSINECCLGSCDTAFVPSSTSTYKSRGPVHCGYTPLPVPPILSPSSFLPLPWRPAW